MGRLALANRTLCNLSVKCVPSHLSNDVSPCTSSLLPYAVRIVSSIARRLARRLPCPAAPRLISPLARHFTLTHALLRRIFNFTSYRMGWDTEEHRGLIPRICSALFLEIETKRQDPLHEFHVEVSYMEI